MGCSGTFDETRATAPRGKLGRELFTIVCDRVGAQALREDVTGASYQRVCHADADGKFADKVDDSLLTPLEPDAKDEAGKPVSLAAQKSHRAYRIGRIEALARRRNDLIDAFEAAIPDENLATKDLGAEDPKKSCEVSKGGANGKLRKELSDTLGRITDLYNDRTIPEVTESLGAVLARIEASEEAQRGLARVSARKGYRPLSAALGFGQATFAYPRLGELGSVLFGSLSRPEADGGAREPFEALLAVMQEEFRGSVVDPSTTLPLGAVPDSKDPSLSLLARPRGSLEFARTILLADDDANAVRTPFMLVRRDGRGMAGVPLVGGALPGPFVDTDGDGLPDADLLGNFVLGQGQKPPPTPFFTPGAADGERDDVGRATAAGKPIYAYVDANKTFLARLGKDFAPLFDPDPANEKDAVMDFLGGLPVVAGTREKKSKAYPADPRAKAAWKSAHDGPLPAKIGEPVTLEYRGVDANDSPLLDLVHAIGIAFADPAMEDVLALLQKLSTERPDLFARFVGMALELRRIAALHPEASLPENSTLWDDLLEVVVHIAETPGILEDLVKAFAKQETLEVKDVFATYLRNKDVLTYDRNDVNGPAYNLTTKSVAPMMTPVDRTQQDVDGNRSAFQRLLQLLHDVNGLGACTKPDAVAHITWKGVSIDYPNDFVVKAACAGFGESAPSRIPQCGILRFENVGALLLDVALNRAQFDIRDPCLKKMMESPLSGIVGGADKFLEEVSGIDGLSTHPTVNGIARLVFFDVAHDGSVGDTKNKKTHDFLQGIVDPFPASICPRTPFTDTDGKVIPLRKCASFDDTLRGRDDNALFPLEQLDFIRRIGPLAAAFADHGGNLLFVDLFDALHVHWGSSVVGARDCSATGDRKTNPRWCGFDGAVSYEPLLADVLGGSDLFPALHDGVPTLSEMTIEHCETRDPTTRACTKSVPKNGVTVLADAARALLLAGRNKDLANRFGKKEAIRNDGKPLPQTPVYLLIDALKAFDLKMNHVRTKDPGDARPVAWKRARSSITDALFATHGEGAKTEFDDPSITKVVPVLLGALRAQRLAHCPDPGVPCAWAKAELLSKTETLVTGPSFAAVLDLVEALRKDPGARTELDLFFQHLLGGSNGQEEAAANVTLAAIIDALHAFEDDASIVPLLHAFSEAVAPAMKDEGGKVLARGAALAGTDALTFMLARVYDKKSGAEICAKEVDPNRAMPVFLERLVTPSKTTGLAPLEVFLDVMADVNRVRPGEDAPLDGPDYAVFAKEVGSFLTDRARGLEQVYEVIRIATENP